MRKRDGRNIAFAYDALNRVTAKTYPQGGATPVHYGYDLRNLQLSARFDSQAGEGITNAYDGFGRLTAMTTNMGGVTRTLAYQYDAAGNRIEITHPDGAWFGTIRDGLCRPYWLYSADPAAGIYYSSYRPDGLPAGQSRSNGASTWTSRDAIQRFNGLGHYYGGGTPADALWLYQHNPASQIASATRDNDGYAWTGHYAVNRNYTTNGLNQYTASGSLSPTYDGRGNLQSAASSTHYTYSAENMLTSAWNQATLNYDPLNRLFQIAGATAVRQLYDGATLIGEYDSSHNLLRRYVHGPGVDEPLVWYEGTGTGDRRFYHADERGSIVATSNSSGTVLGVNTYDEYGIPGSGNTGRFQYTGQQWLGDIGMYRAHQRSAL